MSDAFTRCGDVGAATLKKLQTKKSLENLNLLIFRFEGFPVNKKRRRVELKRL